MHRIKTISAQMLADKMADSAVTADDTMAKRDIMSLLVRARKADRGDGYQMTDQDMMDQVLTFLGAGHETTASGLAWALWLLANDKPSQTQLREEVTPFLVDTPRPTYRTIKEMQWLDCVVYVPSSFTPRCDADSRVQHGEPSPHAACARHAAQSIKGCVGRRRVRAERHAHPYPREFMSCISQYPTE